MKTAPSKFIPPRSSLPTSKLSHIPEFVPPLETPSFWRRCLHRRLFAGSTVPEKMKERFRFSLPVSVVVLSIAYIYFSTVFVFIDRWFGLTSSPGIMNAFVFTALAIMCVSNYATAILTDPGRAPSSYLPDMEDLDSPIHEIKRKVQRMFCFKFYLFGVRFSGIFLFSYILKQICSFEKNLHLFWLPLHVYFILIWFLFLWIDFFISYLLFVLLAFLLVYVSPSPAIWILEASSDKN